MTGDPNDVKAFNDMIAACRKKSKSFVKLIDDINNDKTRGKNVSIGVGAVTSTTQPAAWAIRTSTSTICKTFPTRMASQIGL